MAIHTLVRIYRSRNMGIATQQGLPADSQHTYRPRRKSLIISRSYARIGCIEGVSKRLVAAVGRCLANMYYRPEPVTQQTTALVQPGYPSEYTNMSTLAYRDWDLWLNTGYFAGGQIYDGYFECVVMDSLMVSQSVEFLAERQNICNRLFVDVAPVPIQFVQQSTRTPEGERCIRMYESLDTSKEIKQTLEEVRIFIDSLALAVDAPLSCYSIRFVSTQHGKIVQANRSPIGRGFSFEVEERGTANLKLRNDLEFYQNGSDSHLVVGRRHYMTGMQLLALEDQVSGLIDAAFMQFYQGCESLCRDPEGNLDSSKKYIAANASSDGRELQIIAHQVWRVRNKYFGHGDVSYNLHANQNREQAAMVARQVLVARYLCRQLLDLAAPSRTSLIREMGLFFKTYSGNFVGQVNQLLNEFKVPFDRPECRIYDANGAALAPFTFPP